MQLLWSTFQPSSSYYQHYTYSTAVLNGKESFRTILLYISQDNTAFSSFSGAQSAKRKISSTLNSEKWSTVERHTHEGFQTRANGFRKIYIFKFSEFTKEALKQNKIKNPKLLKSLSPPEIIELSDGYDPEKKALSMTENFTRQVGIRHNFFQELVPVRPNCELSKPQLYQSLKMLINVIKLSVRTLQLWRRNTPVQKQLNMKISKTVLQNKVH